MKVFISSLIGGMEDLRSAAVEAVQSLGHEAITAEQFSADDTSPRVACLSGVREANLVVLIMGARYGAPQQPTGLSATHEEYREAKGTRPVLAFVQQGVEREPAQAAFVEEVEAWEDGRFRAAFSTRDQLRTEVTRAIHRRELALAAAPVDASEMLARALRLFPDVSNRNFHGSGSTLQVAIVGGPAQQILRPIEIERPELKSAIMQAALFGSAPIFDPAHGSSGEFVSDTLVLTQQHGNQVSVDERGSIQISSAVGGGRDGMNVLLEEDIHERLIAALRFGGWLIDHIDASQRLTRVAVAARLTNTGYSAWRTRAEHLRSPGRVTYSGGFDDTDKPAVHMQPPDIPRAALSYETSALADDLLALLRRQRTR
ncbi:MULTISPECIES: DUF4062 domain-containing protein [Sphingomonas]|nr:MULTISPECIES: DUF4062 domain-containing protein [Sphingomonas]MBA2920070.1 DUF4062 domain-containing protein [Sphingomonas sp. CGMCC 1.13658]